MQIAIAEAKAQFAELIRRAEAGEAIELTRYGRPVARIEAIAPRTRTPLIGAMAGVFSVSDPWAGDDEVAEIFSQATQS